MTDGSAPRELFARWCDQIVTSVGEARAELDALNVFPVPDADTGTNVYLTLEAAAQAAAEATAAGADLPRVARAFVDGALRGARGNSGVILSELFRAAVPLLVDATSGGDPVVAGKALAAALRDGADAAWAAVGDPLEGTILSVARAAADAAGEVSGASLPVVLRAATTAARQALDRTPGQLEPLRRAGVVDAGGRALVVVLEATERVLTGRVAPPRSAVRHLPVPTMPRGARGEDVAAAGGPRYEVMYLLDAAADRVDELRRTLVGLGDSVVVVGGDGLWNVHVHVDDAGAAIEAGMAVGRPHRVVVTSLVQPSGGGAEGQRAAVADAHDQQPGPDPTGARTVLITAAGPGLAELFARAGAAVLDTSTRRRPRPAELLDAIVGSGAREVVVLPNDRAVVAAAEVAARQARDLGIRAAVIPTQAQVQGLAALAVHDPARSFDDDVVQMGAAAGHARHGAVTIATRQAMTSAGPCQAGDVLGVVDGDFAVVGADLQAVAVTVAERLLGGSGEMLTLVSGAGAPSDLARRVEQHVLAARPEVDVAVHEGGQAGYPLLLAVE